MSAYGFSGFMPQKFSHWKFSGMERFTKKFCFSRIFLSVPQKNKQAQKLVQVDALEILCNTL